MPLTVLSVAFPLAPVGPGAVGGAEQVLDALDRALVAAGERSLVVACAGSQVAGRLFAFPAEARQAGQLLGQEQRLWARRQTQVAIDTALAVERVDVIHLHGFDFDQYRLPPGVPALVTLHMPVGWYSAGVLERAAQRVQLCCVSGTQRSTCPPALGQVAVVENGVTSPLLEHDDGDNNRGYAMVLGRICPEKNQHAALEAGTRAGVPVLVGGQVFPYREHREYFEQQCQPFFAAGQHSFLGPLEPGRKQRLLSRAKCLLHPTLAPETSSLVAMEAMAVGTPVIAYRSGALTEIVEDGVTGFLVDGVDAMAEAIGRAGELSRSACRRVAAERFSEKRMLSGYFELYRRLAAREPGLPGRVRFA